ncbi:MAG: hypothetical protein JXB00_12660 [Bacteroidales bacterium]|nr:hypothetical protein [Bacteroidales bacterium]
MKKILLLLAFNLVLFSCKTYREVPSMPIDIIQYGKLELHFGQDYFLTKDFFGVLDIDTAQNKSRLVLTMTEEPDKVNSIYNIFKLELNLDKATYKPDLGIYYLDSLNKIRYEIFGKKGQPYYPLDATVNLTAYDSINPYAYKLSGDFDFKAAKKRFYRLKINSNIVESRDEYYDTVPVSGRFDSIYFNFYYRQLTDIHEFETVYDTIASTDSLFLK